MVYRILLRTICLFISIHALGLSNLGPAEPLSSLKRNQELAGFRVANLYSDPDGRVVGAKFRHTSTGAPVYLLQIESVPQVFTWVDTPADSNRGLAHSLEHLLIGKGTKGRYFTLLNDLRLGQSGAATGLDSNFYGLSSGTGMDSFFEQFHAMLDALYKPDFTDTEAEREFYHFGVTTDPTTKKRALIEEGTIYDEMLPTQGRYTYYYQLNKRVLGEQNPFGFDSGGVPDEMRAVTPKEIRRFHALRYRLGPKTGFIFCLDPKERVADFLRRVSQELQQFSQKVPFSLMPATGQPKYPLLWSENKGSEIYPFAGATETASGFIHFAWKPVRTDSMLQLKLLQLFVRGFADKDQSLLHKFVVDSKTRVADLGATGVDSTVFLENSPYFPVPIVEISGIPGNLISQEQIKRLQNVVLGKILEISKYSDQSKSLAAFNDLIASSAKAWRRTESVWIKNPPGFGSPESKSDWKELFDYLEMNPAFSRSLSDETVWRAIDQQLESRKNIWRDVIQHFGLLDSPYATAAAPSPRLLDEIERRRQERANRKIAALMEHYHTKDEQEALLRFEHDEMDKTEEMGHIEASVSRPRFTDHPPLTPDDDIRYKQFQLGIVPVIATIFDRPPTIDIGLSFDLREIPERYYKYLPIFPACLDSIGLKQEGRVVPYSDLVGNIHQEVSAFSVGYDANAISKRADLTVRASATDTAELRRALKLIQQLMQFNYLDVANAGRLRDIIAQRLSSDDFYTKKGESTWIPSTAYSFRFQDDRLFLALNSQFTKAHWNGRLKWLLHDPVNSEQIRRLGDFAEAILAAPSGIARQQLSQKLDEAVTDGLSKELVEYWKKNLLSFPESEMIEGLRQLTSEVQEDLRTGPGKAIDDLRALQQVMLNRRSLHIDLTLSQSTLDQIRPDLTEFLESIPAPPLATESNLSAANTPRIPIMEKLKKRYGLSDEQFPWYVGFVNPDGVSGNVISYADFPGYSSLDRASLIRVLSSKLFAGTGPQSFHMKTWEAGLAYGNSIKSDPRWKFVWYYADRSPDISSLIALVNSMAARVQDLHDPSLVDYALRQIFSIPRSMSTFSQRGKAIALDIRDGNEPETIRRFSEAILKLRQDPDLLSELVRAVPASIGGVLLDEKYKEQQRIGRSMFFFVGPEKVLSDIEQRLPIPKLLRLWPSDYWIE
jgi:Zn-dependent M16 (insulinase) family peptidase